MHLGYVVQFFLSDEAGKILHNTFLLQYHIADSYSKSKGEPLVIEHNDLPEELWV